MSSQLRAGKGGILTPPDLTALQVANVAGQIGAIQLALDDQGAIVPGSAIPGGSVTGTWDISQQLLTMSRDYDSESRDEYKASILYDPVDGSTILAGTVTSYSRASFMEINGWYAVIDPDHLWLYPPPSRKIIPGDPPTGVFQIAIGGALSLLDLHFDSDGQIEPPSAIDGTPIAGSWDPIFGLTMVLERGSRHEITGCVLRTPAEDRVALAGFVTSYDGPRRIGMNGWFGVYRRPNLKEAILETFRHNPLALLSGEVPFDTSNPMWPSILVGGKRFLINDEPKYEWQTILAENWEHEILDEQLVGLSGTAVHAHLSGSDIPFTHPFADDPGGPAKHSYGHFGDDFGFFVAPDPPYYQLLAATDLAISQMAPWFKVDAEVFTALEIANDQTPPDVLTYGGLDLGVPGVLGVEIDQGLIPKEYRPIDGDRVAVFGRWIVDAGHDTFETEIHPPLIVARAYQPILRNGPRVRPQRDPDSTNSSMIGRAYLVSQIFSTSDSGPRGLRAHLLAALSDAVRRRILGPTAPNYIRADARLVYGIGCIGELIASYIVRPPSPRRSPDDQLLASYHYIVHSGVTVSVTRSSPVADEVEVRVTLTGDGHEVKLKGNEAIVSRDELLDQLDPGDRQSVMDYLQGQVDSVRRDHGDTAGDYLQHLMDAGVHMKYYDQPVAASLYDEVKVVAGVPVGELPLSGAPPSAGDDRLRGTVTFDGQPFPIYGWLYLQWKRA